MPICRQKHFIDARMECELLTDFLLKDKRKATHYLIRIELLYQCMNPVKWGYLRDHNHETILDVKQDTPCNYVRRW